MTIGGQRKSENMNFARIEFGSSQYSTKIIIEYRKLNDEIEYGEGTFELDLDDLTKFYVNEINGSKEPVILKAHFNFEDSIKVTFVADKAMMIINNNSNQCYMVANPAELKRIFMDYAEEAILLNGCGEL